MLFNSPKTKGLAHIFVFFTPATTSPLTMFYSWYRDILIPRYSRTKDASVLFYGEPGAMHASYELHYEEMEKRCAQMHERARRPFLKTSLRSEISIMRTTVVQGMRP